MNEQNLVPFTSEQSHEEAVRNGRKGGLASGESKRRKKTVKEAADILLSMPPQGSHAIKLLKQTGIPQGEWDNQLAIVAAMVDRAMRGDVKAAKMIFEILDETQKEEKFGITVADREAVDAFIRNAIRGDCAVEKGDK